MLKIPVRFGTGLAAGALIAATAAAPVQTQQDRYADYLTYEQLTSALRTITGNSDGVATMAPLATTTQGREIWLVTIGSTDAERRAENPAVLVVANLEGNHLIGSSAALHLAEELISRQAEDSAVAELIDSMTFYIVPRLNPDSAELVWNLPGHELPWKTDPEDDDRDGEADEDPGDDLNGDGWVTLMRVRDPEGIWMVDPDEPRLMRRADRTKGERGVYTLYSEGRDDDGDEEYNEDGPGGTHLNRNFPHAYPYYTDHAGRHQVSEIETRALADFAFGHRNLALVLTFSPYDNLRSAPTVRSQPQAPPQIPAGFELPPGMTLEDVADYFRERRAPEAILGADGPYFSYISEHFREMTGLSGSGASGEAGSWPQYVYYQMGLPSFTTPVWTLTADEPAPAPPGTNGQARQRPGRSQRGASNTDARWLEWFDAHGIDGFVDWTPVDHPAFGEVEVGGFVPNVRVNPPPEQIADLCRRHTDFALWLAGQTPRVELIDTSVEAKGGGIYEIEATIANDAYLPTALDMGLQNRAVEPVVMRLEPVEGMTVLTGNIQQSVRSLPGSGGRATHTWLVQAPAGTSVTLTVIAFRAGGRMTATLELNQEDR